MITSTLETDLFQQSMNSTKQSQTTQEPIRTLNSKYMCKVWRQQHDVWLHSIRWMIFVTKRSKHRSCWHQPISTSNKAEYKCWWLWHGTCEQEIVRSSVHVGNTRWVANIDDYDWWMDIESALNRRAQGHTHVSTSMSTHRQARMANSDGSAVVRHRDNSKNRKWLWKTAVEKRRYFLFAGQNLSFKLWTVADYSWEMGTSVFPTSLR